MELSSEHREISAPTIWRRKDAMQADSTQLAENLVVTASKKGYIQLSEYIRPWHNLIEPILIVGNKAMPKVKKMLKLLKKNNKDQFQRAFKTPKVDEVERQLMNLQENSVAVLMNSFGRVEAFANSQDLGDTIKSLL